MPDNLSFGGIGTIFFYIIAIALPDIAVNFTEVNKAPFLRETLNDFSLFCLLQEEILRSRKDGGESVPPGRRGM
jgi:hypothetical protein